MLAADSEPWCDDLATVDALAASGLSRQTIRRRIRRKQWLEPLPGVVCRTTGTLSDDQRLQAALAYGGAGAAISHATAAAIWGFGSRPAQVHVTVPHGRHVRSTERVAVHQTLRPFESRYVAGVWLTPIARTVIDTCLALGDVDQVRNVMGRAVQQERVTVDELESELAIAPSGGSLLPRRALEEITLNAHAASEGRLIRIVLTAGLPLPELNAPVATDLGVKYVDALWRALGKGVEIDGRRYHLDPASWANDLTRQNAIQVAGIVLLRIAAHRLWDDEAGVLADLRAFLAS
jgi:hypothetical protein